MIQTRIQKRLQNLYILQCKCSQKSEKLFQASNATPRLFGRQMPLESIGASNATQGLLGRQMPPRGYWGVKCPPGVLGRQMPHWDYRGVKGHTGVKRPASRFMRSQRLGRQRSGASGIRWGGQGSKFGRQGSGRQRSRASKEMNPEIDVIKKCQ